MSLKTIRGKFGIIIFLITVMVFTNGILSYKGDRNIKSVNKTIFPAYKLSNKMSTSLISVWQYLSDISATRALDGLDDGLQMAEDNAKQFKKSANELKALEPHKKDQIDDILKAFDDYYIVGTNMANIYIKDGTEAGNKFMPQFDEASEKILELTNKFAKEQDSDIENSLDKSAFQNNLSLYILVISGSILIVFIFILSGQVTKPLKELVEYAGAIAKGDLSKESRISLRKDEIGRLAYAFEVSVQSLRNIIAKIDYTSKAVNNFSKELTGASKLTSSASNQVASSIEEISTGASKQLNEINQVSMLMTKLDSDIKKAVDKLEETSRITMESQTISKLGAKSMGDIENNMSSIFQFNKKNVEKIEELEKNSLKINQIVEAITQISNQTNLLALNAAIEAARAGESGRGFSVVSEEIRKLAEESSISAGLITNVVKEIQDQIKEITMYIGNGTQYVENGVAVVNEASSRFNGIEVNANDILNYVREVADFSKDINSVSNRISKYTKDILLIVENSSTFTEEVMAASEENTANIHNMAGSINELTKLTEELSDIVRSFKI
ncbi:methyl-accepting chemotaxis protein [Clostridium sp. C8-1-8]|uniref:methyl-accepting chemotaxis protein n=1 Tax=Clostridium sp. C8-1-8 TaxID=2698831 RepID=UPI001367C1CF|nr:methyl-accepting chemotaxis protein [Clostridium sp. C8-1-8]